MSMPASCLQCGATLAAGTIRCDYCGTPLKTVRPPFQSWAEQSNPNPQPAEAELPPEFARLKRPKPTDSLLAEVLKLLLGIPWTFFSLVFLFIIIVSNFRQETQLLRLANDGITVQGIITRLEVDDSGDSSRYNVYYRFIAPVNGNPQTFEQYASVSQSVYESLETGGRLEVIYSASDPQFSVVKADFGVSSLWPSILGVGMSLLFVGIGLMMVIPGAQAGKHILKLGSQGQLTRATVFARWEETDSDGTSYYVAYAFKVSSRPTGQQIISNAQQSLYAYKKLSIGGQVNIKYLSDNPQICRMANFLW